MSFKNNNSQEIDEKFAAFLTNSNAIRAVSSAVEGTIGPKGLDIMLVDRFGEVTITNDGVTILKLMDINHPAAKMLINIAKAQQEEVGDGTTTATIMAGAMVSEGVNQIIRGVPVARVIEGIKYGVRRAQELLQSKSIPVKGMDDPALKNIAFIAGREHEDIAELVTQAAKLIGEEKLKERNFKLRDIVMAREGAENEVFLGIIVDKEKVNKQMPKEINDVRVMVIDDALEPEKIEEEALGTEAGFARYLALREEFKQNIQKLIDLKVNLVLVGKGICDEAQEMLTDAGVIALERVSTRDLEKVAEHTGARIIKRMGLKKPVEEIRNYIGEAERAYEDEKLEHIRIVGGKGKPMATILVGAATAEIVGERERIAKDAASSLQAAVKGGIVPGGGAVEVAVARELEKEREKVKGMASYGIDCVIAALKRPLAQIVYNAGFNPLEKLEEVIYTQAEKASDAIGVNCDTGELADMLQLGVIDPTLVKTHAVKAAGEIAQAILRIDTIIKKRDEGPAAKGASESVAGMGEMDF
ncbi:TCP-1/cpn60 chaperonin family protein [Thermosediminibacter oceani]|uniref:Chaperonin Cpn60/TCP-1 n=1 Tax=Thermosediminibacter oceani (strain ATCC BAA-1034 / DSM 16646 / JW/IW-1228P) TaxID=555079 RepID=D9S2P2_THEOJ|nr:TCP-1/cpn60 chaperonin family protein [Thermosediminibacter oceani]ADL07669.1 chaperonin Cpn60/TCP-1 [Thermosediminibacter oceani DSM 16646]